MTKNNPKKVENGQEDQVTPQQDAFLKENEVITTEPTVEPTEEPTEGIVTQTDFFRRLEQKVDLLEKAERTLNLTPVWMEFKTPGETKRGIFIGVEKSDYINHETGESQVVTYVSFMGSDKRIWRNGGVNLIDQCNSLKPGQPVEVEYIGKSSKVKRYSIYILS